MRTANDVCRVLCGIARDGVDVHRAVAVQALGRIGHPAAVDTLIGALFDEDEDVRTDAATALARLGDPTAAKQLLENLVGDPCSDVKMAAIDALVRMGDRAVVPWLRRLVRGRDEAIVWDEDEFYADGWDNWMDIQVKAVEGLAALGVEEAADDIAAVIDDEFGQDLTEVGFKALARLGRPGIEALTRYLDDGTARRRRRAAAVLSRIRGDAAKAAVARALRDASADVRLAAARGVAARNALDDRLTPLFSDPATEIRREMVRLCGAQRPTFLVVLLTDPAPEVRRAALEVLCETSRAVSSDDAIERVRALLDDPDPALSGAAAATLAVVQGRAAVGELIARLRDRERPLDERRGALRGLRRIGGDEVVEALVDVLGDEERQVRLDAISALAEFAVHEGGHLGRCARLLMSALQGALVPASADADEAETPEGEARTDSTEAEETDAASVEGSAAVPTSTLDAILAPDTAVSAEAGEEKAIELSDSDREFLALARATPRKRRMPVVPAIAAHRDVRRLAARMLGDLALPEVASALAAALADDDLEVRLNAADSLARLGEGFDIFPADVLARLVEAAADGNRDLRLSAIRALGRAGGEAGREALVAGLGDEDGFVRAEAVRAASLRGEVGPEVEALLDDPDPSVRLAAATAVAQAGGERVVELLVDFAFKSEGYHRREAGRLLRGPTAEAAARRFARVLEDTGRRRQWAVAIEALAELELHDAATPRATAA